MQNIIDAINEEAKVNIDESYTKPVKNEKKFTKFDSIAPQMKNFNHQADILILPKTKDNFIGLLVVKDIGTHSFDIEPIKNKESKTILEALQTIYKRGVLNEPKYSLSSDDGGEFKGVVAKWLYDNSIFHKIASSNRHSQQAVVEKQNDILSRLLNGYMNAKEEQTGKPYNEWTDILSIVRKKLNKLQTRDEKNWIKDVPAFKTDSRPLYEVGETVYYKSDYPINALGKKQPTMNFRTGDYRWNISEPRKIVKVLYYPSPINYRYLLEGRPNVSYTEAQLKPALNTAESKYEVKEIIGKKIIKGKVHYLVWWKGYLKKDATFEPKQNLIDDGLQLMIDEYESKN